MYEEPSYPAEVMAARARACRTVEPPADAPGAKANRAPRPQPRPSPPPQERPALVPLPAFQQAFGSTEIGKFAEAFSRTEVALGEPESFNYDSFPDWEPEPQWSQPSREIKCEDTF